MPVTLTMWKLVEIGGNQPFSSARFAGFPDFDFFFCGGAAFFGAGGRPGIPGGRAIPLAIFILGIPPPFRICFIIF